MSVQNYIAIFKYLTHRSEVKEHHSKIITRFVWGLRPKIRHVMITGPYDLDIVEETFDVALKLDFTFKTLVNAKARCFKCDGYGHMIICSPRQHVRLPNDDIDDSKVVENVHISSKTVSIIKRHISWFRHTDY